MSGVEVGWPFHAVSFRGPLSRDLRRHMNETAESVTLDRPLLRLRVHLPDLSARYQIASLGVFGSYIRGDQ
jgi:predicted nucleotidyltransferase